MRHGGDNPVFVTKVMKHRFLLIIAAIAIVTGSVAAYYRAGVDNKAPQYVTATVTRGDVVNRVEATGTLQAVTTVQVGAQVSGTIKALHADYNSIVKKGQVIAELDPALFQTQVDQARASLVKLQADVERAKVDVQDTQAKLRRAEDEWKQQLISQADYDTAVAAANQAQAALKSAEAQVTQAQASLNQAEVSLDHTIIRAPIDGVVISRSVDVGQTVAASLQAPTLFTLANDLSHMQVNASIDEADIGKVSPGEHSTFTVDAYPGQTFAGTVSQVRLEPKVESNVVSYITTVDVPNPELKLKPGMTATVTVEVARADNVLRVPNAALRFRPTNGQPEGARATSGQGTIGATGTSGGSGGRPRGAQGENMARLWVMQDGQLHPVRVKTGISDGTTTAVIDGQIAEGATVVTGITNPTSGGQSSGSPLLPFGGRGRFGSNNRQGGASAARGQGAGR